MESYFSRLSSILRQILTSGLFRNMVIYGLGALFLKGISFFLIPLYTRMLSPEAYGNLELLNTFTSILEIVFAMGLFQYLYMDFFHHDNAGRRKLIQVLLSTYMAISTTLYLATALLLVFHHEHVLGSLDLYLVYLGILISYLNFFQNIFILILKLKERVSTVTILQIVLGVIGMLLNIYFVYYLRIGIAGILWANLINLGISFLIAYTLFGEHFRNFKFTWDPHQVKGILRLSLPFVPGALAFWMMNSANRWIILHYGSLSDVGIFSLAVKFTSIFDPLIIQPFLSSNNPRTLKRFAVGMYSQRLKVLFPFVIVFFLLMGWVVRLAASWMINPTYFDSLPLIPVMVSGLSLSVLAQVTGLLLLFRKKVKKTFTSILCGSVVSVIASFLLVPHFGSMGAAFGTILGNAVWMALIIIFYLQERKTLLS